MSRGRLVAVVGPTAVGKSDLALRLAEALGGQIVSADSRQVYRRMDIGTAKPTAEEQARVPHHLIDVVDPDERYDLAQFQCDAYAAIDAIIERGRLPLLVGGTGLYVRAVVAGYELVAVAPQMELRAALEQRAAEIGHEALHGELAALDPAAAERIDPRNVRRVIRAIEVARGQRGRSRPGQSRYDVLQIGLVRGRTDLYERIDRRVDTMIAAGLLEEVRGLLAAGYGRDLASMSGIGYRQIAACLAGERTLADAVQEIKHQTHRFVRQQATWFRQDDPAIIWLDAEPDPLPAALRLVARFLSESYASPGAAGRDVAPADSRPDHGEGKIAP